MDIFTNNKSLEEMEQILPFFKKIIVKYTDHKIVCLRSIIDVDGNISMELVDWDPARPHLLERKLFKKK